MKLTKTRLKQIIKEEMQALLKEEGDTIPYIGQDYDQQWSTKEISWEDVLRTTARATRPDPYDLTNLIGKWVRYQGQPVQVKNVEEQGGNYAVLSIEGVPLDPAGIEGFAVKAPFLTSPTWDDAFSNPGKAVGAQE